MTGVMKDKDLKGIIPRLTTYVFEFINNQDETKEFNLQISMLQIYLDRIMDLFNPAENNMKVRQDKSKGVQIDVLTEQSI